MENNIITKKMLLEFVEALKEAEIRLYVATSEIAKTPRQYEIIMEFIEKINHELSEIRKDIGYLKEKL
jgi:hypothetical protein